MQPKDARRPVRMAAGWLLAIAVLGGAGWFALTLGEASSAPQASGPMALPEQETVAPAPEDHPLGQVMPGPSGPSRSGEEQGERLALGTDRLAPAAEGAEPSVPEEPTIALAGHIVLHERGSVSDLAMNGSVEVTVWNRRRGRGVTVPVVAGLFELRVLPRAGVGYLTEDGSAKIGDSAEEMTFTLAAPALDAGKRLVLFDPAANRVLPSGASVPFGTLDAVVTVIRGATLELIVLDETTLRHLTEVDVFVSTSTLPTGTIDPRGMGPTPLTRGATSPMLLSPRGQLAAMSNASLIVGARGHAWKSMTVDLTTTHERTIQLQRSGDLTILLNGEVPQGATLRLRTEGRIYSERRSPSSPSEYDGLGAGSYQASVELGPSYNSPLVLASSDFKIQAGVQSRVTLAVQPREPILKADLAGVVHMDSAWGLEALHLQLRQLTPSKRGGRLRELLELEPLDRDADVPRHYAFQMKGLETGSYSLTLDALNFTKTVDLPPEGLQNLQLDIPRPVHVTIRVEDALTGAPVPEITYVAWSPRRPDGVKGGRSDHLQRDPKTGHFQLRAPACEITLRAGGNGYSGESLTFTAREGLEIVARVTARPSATIELRDGDVTIPWPAGLSHRVMSSDGEVLPTMTTFSSNGDSWFTVDQPGHYAVEVPAIGGFLGHPPVQLEMTAGPRKTVEVHLTRE